MHMYFFIILSAGMLQAKSARVARFGVSEIHAHLSAMKYSLNGSHVDSDFASSGSDGGSQSNFDPWGKSLRSAVIVGLLRSAEKRFAKSLDSLRSICEKFDPCTMLILENDSNDGTASALRTYAKQSKNIMVLTGEGLDVISNRRTRRLAAARNLLLDFVQENYASRDFLIMADLDGMVFEPVNAFMKPLFEKDWDVMTYYSAAYYDFWALRCGSRMENCWNRDPPTCSDEFPCIQDLKRGAGRVEVASAFNGIAVYKIPVIGSCKYNGTNPEPPTHRDEDCEHVAFHRCLRSQGAKIHISASRLRIW